MFACVCVCCVCLLCVCLLCLIVCDCVIAVFVGMCVCVFNNFSRQSLFSTYREIPFYLKLSRKGEPKQ